MRIILILGLLFAGVASAQYTPPPVPTGNLINPMTTAGDMITGGTGGAAQRLGIGTNGKVLAVVAGQPAWNNQTQQVIQGNCAGSAASGASGWAINGLGGRTSNGSCSAGNVSSFSGTVVNSAGALGSLQVHSSAGGSGAGDGIATVMVNATATPITCTLGTSTTCSDAVHTYAVNAGDLVWISGTTISTNTGNIAISLIVNSTGTSPVSGVFSTIPGGNTIGGVYFNTAADFSSVSPFIANVQIGAWFQGPSNNLDTYLVRKPGGTATARFYDSFLDYDGSMRWLQGKNIFNDWILYDAVADAHRLYLASSGKSFINSVGANPVVINGVNPIDTNEGSGLDVYTGGGATPALGLRVATAAVTISIPLILSGAASSGTSGSIGGSLLTAGGCSSGTVTMTGVSASAAIQATPTTYPGDGNWWEAYVSAANTVTVKVCASVAGTPTSSTYNVRAIN